MYIFHKGVYNMQMGALQVVVYVHLNMHVFLGIPM